MLPTVARILILGAHFVQLLPLIPAMLSDFWISQRRLRIMAKHLDTLSVSSTVARISRLGARFVRVSAVVPTMQSDVRISQGRLR